MLCGLALVFLAASMSRPSHIMFSMMPNSMREKHCFFDPVVICSCHVCGMTFSSSRFQIVNVYLYVSPLFGSLLGTSLGVRFCRIPPSNGLFFVCYAHRSTDRLFRLDLMSLVMS